jgi:hypothetical protein
MPISGSWALRLATATIVAASTAGAGAQAPPDLHVVLRHVGERIAEYYKRAQRVMCLEKATVQPVGRDFSPHGFGRVTEYELHVEADAPDSPEPAEAKVVRQLIRINGRPPRERDKTNRDGCTDANPLSTEPLAFLLPKNRDEYKWLSIEPGKGKDANALVIEYASVKGSDKGELAEDPRGHEDCFTWSLDSTIRGRVWVDAKTYEVLRFEQHLARMADIRVPSQIQRKHNLDDYVVVERHDTTIRYKNVAFSDPDESMLLPESIETLMVVRGGLESIRVRQVFSDYKRFLTAGRIVK